MKPINNLILSLSLLVSTNADANSSTNLTFVFEKTKGSLSALAVGKPRALKINITGSGAEGQMILDNEVLNGSVKIDMNSLKSGIDLRDRHLKETYIKVTEFPFAELKIQNLKVTKDEILTGARDKEFKGKLLFHGVEKPMSGKLNIMTGEDKAIFEVVVSFTLNIKDFNVDVPSYLGVTVAEKVDVTAKSIVKVESSKPQAPIAMEEKKK